ncbi:MAG: cytochrome c-type biogenesis protein [Acidimicrobiales bacterium]|jgi:cytochrome c-type biogenesis protein CcmH
MPWAVLAVVLAVALAFGVSRPDESSTAAQRAAAIDADLRCPSCEVISVSDSSASTAVAIRQVVAARVREGQSTAQIESFLESRYGLGILLRPPASGLSAAVWVVPIAAVAVGVLGLGAFFWRRRRIEPVQVAAEDRDLVEDAMAPGRGEASS